MGHCYSKKNIFLHYRTLDKENNIIIGIINDTNNNSIERFGISINNKIYRLKFVMLLGGSVLVYDFEDRVRLTFSYSDKKKNLPINMELSGPNYNIVKNINNKIINKYKKINYNTDEIDMIHTFFNVHIE